MFWYLQIKGLLATGLLAGLGVVIMRHGYDHASAYKDKWSHLIGWILLGGIFIFPFVAVLVSVVLSRWPGH